MSNYCFMSCKSILVFARTMDETSFMCHDSKVVKINKVIMSNHLNLWKLKFSNYLFILSFLFLSIHACTRN